MFLDNLLNIYKIIAALGFVICIFGFVYHINKRSIKAILFAILGFLLVISIFKISDIIIKRSKFEIKERLNKSVFQKIYFNNNEVESFDLDTIKYSLIMLNFIQGHHSYPLDNCYDLKIVGKFDTVVLRLRPDSEIKDEYWVFYDKYKLTSNNEIGRIRNDVFKKYKK